MNSRTKPARGPARAMPPAKRGRPASNAIVPHTPPRGKINLGTLQMASPKTGERVTSMKRANTPAFCIYSNVRQHETGARIESYYGTLSLYLPEGSADGREKINNICKFGDPDYQKPAAGVTPEKNLLADKNLLCAGKFFTETKWNKNKNYMAGLPAGAPGCMQWNMLNIEHAQMLHEVLQSLMSDIGECPECPPLNMFDMYKTEFPGSR